VLPSIVIAIVFLLTLRRLFFGYPRPAEAHTLLKPREVAFIEAAAEVVFPEGGAIPVSGSDANLPRYTDGFLDSLPISVQREIRALFMLIEQATLIMPAPGRRGFRRFTKLSLDQRAAVLRGWMESRFFLRQLAFTGLRAVLTMGYLGHPTVLAHLGVAPLDFETPICEADLIYPPIGQHPDEISLTQDDLTPPSDGTPIDLEGPLHPDFTGGAGVDGVSGGES
jgi:hypothetical protein